MLKSVTIYAPATVSNIGPGFDLMGFALDEPGDILEIKPNQESKLRIVNKSGVSLPENPELNVAAVAVSALLKELGSKQGFDLIFREKINPGSGIGSSAASCAAAVFGVNILLSGGLSPMELIPCALAGEFIASGSTHADNIAPALLGNIVLIRSYDPFDIIRLNAPEKLYCTLVHPQIEIQTKESRKLIPEKISVKDALVQAGNLASLVTGFLQSDFNRIESSVEDRIAEPVRAEMIPGYRDLKKKLRSFGYRAVNISGSGPSVFALSGSAEDARIIAEHMSSHYTDLNIPNHTYVSRISNSGTRILT